jgi:hypothetical protein
VVFLFLMVLFQRKMTTVVAVAQWSQLLLLVAVGVVAVRCRQPKGTFRESATNALVEP